MNLQEIKAAVEAGRPVHWTSLAYVVQKAASGEYLVVNTDCRTAWVLVTDQGLLKGAESAYFEPMPAPQPSRKWKLKLVPVETPVWDKFTHGYMPVYRIGRNLAFGLPSDQEEVVHYATLTRNQMLRVAAELRKLARDLPNTQKKK